MIRDITLLRAFLSVVRLGSVGRAAEELHVTQSALTRQIHRLEADVQVPLFVRHAAGMSMTTQGAALERYASLLVTEAENAVREMDALRGMRKGLVKIGSVASALESIVPAAVNNLLLECPGLQVRIVEGMDAELAVALIKGDIDLAVSFSMDESDELEMISASGWQDGCHFVAARNHPLRERGNLAFSDLVDAKWVLPPRRMGPREEWQQAFVRNGYTPPAVSVETHSVGAIRTLVAHAGFLSWLPDLLLAYQGTQEAIAILEVPGAATLRNFAVYKRRIGVLSQPTIKLLEELRLVVPSLASVDAEPDSGFPLRRKRGPPDP